MIEDAKDLVDKETIFLGHRYKAVLYAIKDGKEHLAIRNLDTMKSYILIGPDVRLFRDVYNLKS